jgi:hypothetical protein
VHAVPLTDRIGYLPQRLDGVGADQHPGFAEAPVVEELVVADEPCGALLKRGEPEWL